MGAAVEFLPQLVAHAEQPVLADPAGARAETGPAAAGIARLRTCMWCARQRRLPAPAALLAAAAGAWRRRAADSRLGRRRRTVWEAKVVTFSLQRSSCFASSSRHTFATRLATVPLHTSL